MTAQQRNFAGWISAAVALVALLVGFARSALSTSYAASSDLQDLAGRVRVSESKIQAIEVQSNRMASQIDDIHKYLLEGARR